jgi:hypothetical protein
MEGNEISKNLRIEDRLCEMPIIYLCFEKR